MNEEQAERLIKAIENLTGILIREVHNEQFAEFLGEKLDRIAGSLDCIGDRLLELNLSDDE